jgi:formylglycine-generating enzyme required for sulfatase activity
MVGFGKLWRQFMRRMIVLGALIVLAVYPTMGATPIEKGAKELAPAQKQVQSQIQSQEKPASPRPPAGTMVLIPAGEFTMGSQDGDSDERPVHKVQLNAFSIDVYEVTVGQYEEFLRSGEAHAPLDWNTMNQSAHHKRPVANIDWADAAAYCKWAGKRLPTDGWPSLSLG